MIKLNTFHKFVKYPISICFIYTFSILINSEPSIERLNIPDGFKITIFADDLDSPRQITQTDNGHIIVGSKKGTSVTAFINENNDGKYKRVTLATGLKNPAGVAVHKNDLYIAEMSTVWVINQIDSWLESDHKKLLVFF